MPATGPDPVATTIADGSPELATAPGAVGSELSWTVGAEPTVVDEVTAGGEVDAGEGAVDAVTGGRDVDAGEDAVDEVTAGGEVDAGEDAVDVITDGRDVDASEDEDGEEPDGRDVDASEDAGGRDVDSREDAVTAGREVVVDGALVLEGLVVADGLVVGKALLGVDSVVDEIDGGGSEALASWPAAGPASDGNLPGSLVELAPPSSSPALAQAARKTSEASTNARIDRAATGG